MIEKTLVQDLISPELDDILAIREQLGADLAKVSLVTRTWSGTEIGDGDYIDVVEEMHPTPGVVDLSHSWRVAQGGAFKQGDLILTMISKNKFPTVDLIDGSSPSELVQKFYLVNGFFYTVIKPTEKYVYWDVQVRRSTDQTRGIKTS